MRRFGLERLRRSDKLGLQLPAILAVVSFVPAYGSQSAPCQCGSISECACAGAGEACGFGADVRCALWFIPEIDVFQIFCSCGSMVEFVVGVERRQGGVRRG